MAASPRKSENPPAPPGSHPSLPISEQRLRSLLDLHELAVAMTESELFQYGLDEAKRYSGSRIACLHLIQDDEESVSFTAWSPPDPGRCDTASDAGGEMDKAQAWDECIGKRRPIVNNDIQARPGVKAPVLRHMMVPVVDGDRVRLVLGVGNKPTSYDEADVQMLQLFASNLWRVVRNRRAEISRAENERRYHAIFETIPVPMWVYDLGTLRFLEVNQAAIDHYGWTRDEFLAMTILAIRPAEDVPHLMAHLHDTRVGRSLTGIRRHLKKTGEMIQVDVVSHTLDFAGRHARIVIAQDVTERLHAQDRLTTLSRAIEQAPFSVMITDTAGAIQYVNPQFTRTTGYEPAEVIGQNPRILKSGTHPPEFYSELWAAITAGGDWRGEIQNRKKDGSLYWGAASISPVTDPGGRIAHFIGVIEDITARKLLEQQFRQAQKMEAVGRLAGGVAHDFNNLLTVISGFTEIVADSIASDDPRSSQLAEVRSAAARAAALTKRLLAFSRRQVLQPETLDLNAAVSGMEKMIRRLIGEDITVRLDLAPGVPSVVADVGQIEQALLNLVVNARDAMPNGGTLEIATSEADMDEAFVRTHPGASLGSYVVISVRDTGCGMTEDVKAHLFEPFFTTKPQGRGTGLGLAMVYGFVKQSGGYIDAESSLGAGTTFRIYLPETSVPAGRPAAPAAVPESRGTETILVVEDEPAVADVVRRVLTASGYSILVARSADEALASCEGHPGPVHMLITDVVMPGLNGREVARLVRGLRPGIRVLYMSGFTDEVIAPLGILEPGIALIPKPFLPSTLRSKVREVLDAPPGPLA